jgi:glycosyltransferase involved in cell wall biosynthesis
MKDPKKILFITSAYYAPSYRRLWKKAVSLKNDGYKVAVICPAGKKGLKETKEQGIKIYGFNKKTKRNSVLGIFLGEIRDLLSMTSLVLSAYSKREFATIHLVNPSDVAVFAVLWFKLLGYRFVYESNGSFSSQIYREEKLSQSSGKWFLNLFLKSSQKLALFFSDWVIVPDWQEKKRLVALGKNKRRIITIEPLPDLKEFYDLLPHHRYKMGFSKVAIYAGGLKFSSGILKLLVAVDFIVNRLLRKDILFILAGEGKDEERLKKIVQERGLEGNVFFTGWLKQKKLLNYLAAADLGIIPEENNLEGKFRDSAFEYLAVGKPIVAFDFPGGEEKIG